MGRSGEEKPLRVADNGWQMALKLEVSDEELLGEVMGALTLNGCLADRIAPTVCRVVCPRTWDPREAQLEVGFFVRAWQVRHPGVTAVLSW
jgi:hypothetical protein